MEESRVVVLLAIRGDKGGYVTAGSTWRRQRRKVGGRFRSRSVVDVSCRREGCLAVIRFRETATSSSIFTLEHLTNTDHCTARHSRSTRTMSTSGPSRQTVNASYHPGGVSGSAPHKAAQFLTCAAKLPPTHHVSVPPAPRRLCLYIGLHSPANTSQGASPSLRRARRPFKLGNAFVGGAVALFAAGVYAYSISSVKQDDFVSGSLQSIRVSV